MSLFVVTYSQGICWTRCWFHSSYGEIPSIRGANYPPQVPDIVLLLPTTKATSQLLTSRNHQMTRVLCTWEGLDMCAGGTLSQSLSSHMDSVIQPGGAIHTSICVREGLRPNRHPARGSYAHKHTCAGAHVSSWEQSSMYINEWAYISDWGT